MHAFWEIMASNALVAMVLAGSVALLSRFWRDPKVLHLLWMLVLLKLVTPPLVTLPVPMPARDRLLAAAKHTTGPADFGVSTAVSLKDDRNGPAVTVGKPDQPVGERRPPESEVAALPSTTEPQRTRWLAVLASIWAAGIVVVACSRICHILRFVCLLRTGVGAPPAVLQLADDIGRRLQLRRVPEILLVRARVSPMVWSLGGQPRVILPTELFGRLAREGQRAILAHELGHVQRKDHWVRLLEFVISTLFWWHPVVWWACRQLRELEEQCCDGLVLGSLPQSAKAYATAILDTVDFLSGQTLAVPLVATGAAPAVAIARRIRMLRNPESGARLTASRLFVLVAIAALPMTLAVAAKPQQADLPQHPDKPVVAKQLVAQRRAAHKLVADFPAKTDLSTPESALAAYHRASARMDAKAVLELSWVHAGERGIEELKRFWRSDPEGIAIYNRALAEAEIIEVLTVNDAYASVISKLEFPTGVGRCPYSRRSFGKINGVWKNLGEGRLPSLQAARDDFERKKERLWQNYAQVRDQIRQGRSATTSVEPRVRTARIAPDEALGISVEKADLMGRIEWAMMHGARDVTARKSIEWGDVQKDKVGNRTIRYQYYATIWDKDVYIMNQVFTFDAKGNILSVKDIEGFPQKKTAKPIDVSTQEGMKSLVEGFFHNNFRDITAREPIEWGPLTKTKNGNSSIRYKYRAKIWDKDTLIMNQTFTFDPKGKFVSFKNVDGFPQKQ